MDLLRGAVEALYRRALHDQARFQSKLGYYLNTLCKSRLDSQREPHS